MDYGDIHYNSFNVKDIAEDEDFLTVPRMMEVLVAPAGSRFVTFFRHPDGSVFSRPSINLSNCEKSVLKAYCKIAREDMGEIKDLIASYRLYEATKRREMERLEAERIANRLGYKLVKLEKK